MLYNFEQIQVLLITNTLINIILQAIVQVYSFRSQLKLSNTNNQVYSLAQQKLYFVYQIIYYALYQNRLRVLGRKLLQQTYLKLISLVDLDLNKVANFKEDQLIFYIIVVFYYYLYKGEGFFSTISYFLPQRNIIVLIYLVERYKRVYSTIKPK